MKKTEDIALTMLQLLINTGATFEDENVSFDIMVKTLDEALIDKSKENLCKCSNRTTSINPDNIIVCDVCHKPIR